MNELWLLYDRPDFEANRDFASLMRERGEALGLSIAPVCLDELSLEIAEDGKPLCLRAGIPAHPRAILSRQRSSLVSFHFERMGVLVFNNSRVCAICNDKRVTHQFLSGLPMPQTVFLPCGQTQPPPGTRWPVIVKPACSHGGDRVALVQNAREWQAAVAAIQPEPLLQQAVVSQPGRDLRVYVLHGRILAGVMRTARVGVVSNFKRGGQVELHTLTPHERALAEAVIDRFSRAGAPLHMAGVDLLYDHGQPVIGEVEDVVGSRMLYKTSDIDIVSLYLRGLNALQAKAE